MPDVAAALFAPVAGYPDCSVMRRPAMRSGNPDVAMPIPAVVARNPDIAGMRSSGHNLNRARRRRANADDDLSVGSADCKKESGYGDKESALYVHENLRLLMEWMPVARHGVAEGVRMLFTGGLTVWLRGLKET
jgi:hypothetical protein